MLSLLLLTAGLQAAPAPIPDGGSDSVSPSMVGRNIWSEPSSCRTRPTLTVTPTSPRGGLMWRTDDPPVALYRLLDRYSEGCSAPIVVMERVPGSNAIGREAVSRIRRTPVEETP